LIYIYHDFGGTHTTSLAAAYHLNILTESKTVPDKNEILEVPYFNKLKKKDAGKFIFHGEDEEGNRIYTLGRRSSKLSMKCLHNFCEMLNSNKLIEEKIVLSNTSPVVPFAMTLGGFLSRGLGVDVLGVPLLVKGAQKCCGNIAQLVNETKRMAKESNNLIVNIENKEYQA
jgi:hypothetical protein